MRHLSTMMGSYPKTAPLKEHRVSSPLVELDFADIAVASQGWDATVRECAYEVVEIPIVPFLQAYEVGRPYVLLPFVVTGFFHHKSIVCRADSDLKPDELNGKTVAVRSYSQTTPFWVRGVLADEYGMKVSEVNWLTQEDTHVLEYQEPAWCTRRDFGGRSLEQVVLDGDADAALVGPVPSGNPQIRTLIPQPEAAAQSWWERTQITPVNHLVAIRREIADAEPEVVREVFRMLVEAREISGDERSVPDLQPIGFENVRPSLEAAVRYAHEQQVTRNRYQVDELFGAVLDALA